MAGLAVAVGAGIGVAFGLGPPGRAAASYAVGLAVAGAVLVVASLLVARASARSPVLGLVAALGSYAVTILGFALVLVLVDPDVVAVRAWAAGLAVGAVLATGTAVRRSMLARELR